LPSSPKELAFTQVDLLCHRPGTLPLQYLADPEHAGAKTVHAAQGKALQ